MAMRRIDPIHPAVMRRLDQAIPAAMNDTTAAAAIYAKRNHPTWKNVTGTLEGSIQMRAAQKVGPTRWRGVFGSFAVHYAIYQELGTRFIRAGHFLRNAADAEFPKLSIHLRRHLS